MPNTPALKPHGLDLYAPGALTKLFEQRRQQFGDAVMRQPDPSNPPNPDPNPNPEPNPGGGDPNDPGKGGAGKGGDKGFPANTPVAEMKPEEQAAYYKHQSRKQEERLRAYGDLTPEQAKQFKQDAETARQNSMTEVERAKEEGRAEMRAQLGAERARGAFEKALVGRTVDPGAMLGLNLSQFVDGDKAKADEIKQWVEDNSTAVQTSNDQRQRFPDLGQGNRGNSKVTDRDAGLSEAERRFGKKS